MEIVLVVLIGISLGSFVNMLVYRARNDISLLQSRSINEFNGEALIWKDLIPILSFLWYRGKDRATKKALPLHYPIIEIISGGLAIMMWFFLVEQNLELFQLVVLGVTSVFFVYALLFFALYDFLYWEVDTRYAKGAIFIGIILTILMFLFVDQNLFCLLTHLGAALIGYLAVWVIIVLTKGGGMGEGDTYLLSFVGLFTGLVGLYIASMITVIIGALVGIVIATYKKKLKGVRVQLAPFIALGGILAFLYQDYFLELADWWGVWILSLI